MKPGSPRPAPPFEFLQMVGILIDWISIWARVEKQRRPKVITLGPKDYRVIP